MTVLFAHSTTAASENVVLSMILHSPHHAATTSSMTALPSAFARLRTSAKGLPSMNGMWTAAGAGGASAQAAGEAMNAAATAATRAGNFKRFSLYPSKKIFLFFIPRQNPGRKGSIGGGGGSPAYVTDSRKRPEGGAVHFAGTPERAVRSARTSATPRRPRPAPRRGPARRRTIFQDRKSTR